MLRGKKSCIGRKIRNTKQKQNMRRNESILDRDNRRKLARLHQRKIRENESFE